MTTGRIEETTQQPNLTRGLVRWAIRGVSFKVFVAAILFLAAGRLDWLWAWLYVGIFLAFDAATALAVIPRSPGLLIERTSVGEGTKKWDIALFSLSAGFLPMIAWLLAGLDERFGWTAALPLWLHVAGAAITALGYGIVVWAMASNAFFSATVRIQSDRGHAVASGRAYRVVRHPGYVGAILFTVAMAVMLGSWWALIPAVAAAILYVVRTALEDRTLLAELPGYQEYAQQTRYRLIPGIW
jgi:protein-S-isoprenylcysteine O-methyltransferase Ste14